MTASKVRLKFRVSAYDGISAGELPEPRWTEKWGVGLFDYEEFHVTDQLLKLPFQEATPKTVCIFSISDGSLAFRMLDPDRRSTVNGVERRDAVVTTGDKIKIGDTLTIEVALAPPKNAARAAAGPSLADALPEIPKLDPEEGPTLTLAPAGSHEVEQKRDADIPPSPIFHDASRSVVIDEPSLNGFQKKKPTAFEPELTPRPAPKTEGPLPGFVPEAKVELADVPHAAPDRSLDERMRAMAVLTDENIRPLYAEDADLSAKPTLAERIMSAIARILRRDDVNPLEEPFPVENTDPARPWIPDGVGDPGFAKRPARESAPKSPFPDRPGVLTSPKPWIPEFVSAAARVRGRALVFLVAAIGALMIAVGVFRIQYRIAQIQAPRPEDVPKVEPEMSRGLPISIIEEKVRRMRAPVR